MLTAKRCSQVEKADSARNVNLAEHLQEGLLRQILREGRVARHAQANGIDAAAVFHIEMLERRCVPGLREPNDVQFGLLAERYSVRMGISRRGW
jgi:hypothetical protein